jgi:hypothetical protein
VVSSQKGLTAKLLLKYLQYNQEEMLLRRKLLLLSMVPFVLLCFSVVVSVDAASMWSRTYGGESADRAYSLVATSDGGYAIAGTANAIDGFIESWLVKTDSNGVMEWNRTYGGSGEEFRSLVVTSDGGYAIVGYAAPYAAKFWLVKTDSNGIMQWNKTYEGTGDDVGTSLVVASDGGYAIACGSLLVKTDASGNMEWNRTYGGNASSLVATSDGGYALAGSTGWIYDVGGPDFWLAKTDALGNMQWNRTYGGTGWQWGSSLVVTSDGGYAIAGTWDHSPAIFSYRGYPWLINTDALGNMQGNKTHALASSPESSGAGRYEIWLVKTDSNGLMLWNKTYGGTGDATASSLVVAPDGGYAISGFTLGADGSDFLLVKADALGNMEWNQTYGGTGHDMASSLVATSDGGYAIAGTWNYITSYGEDFYGDFWLVKTDEFGVAPEYSSWLVPALVLTATAFVIINKKRLLNKRSQKH